MQIATMLSHRLVNDKLFWTAVIAGPVFWLCLFGPDFQIVLPHQLGQFLLLVLLYPVVEELVFRGALQTALRKSAWGRCHWQGFTLANLITSFVFVAFHLFGHPFLWALSVFAPSLVYGYFRDRYQSTTPPIFLHIFYNGGYYLLFYSQQLLSHG